jgi:fucose permease
MSPSTAGNQAVNTKALSWAAYAGMFVFGIVMALLGAVLPSLSERLAFSLSDVGRLFLFMNGAMLACSLLLGLAMDRVGLKPPLALGPLLVSGALLLVVSARSFAGLVPALLLLGIGGGALNGGTNVLAADLHTDERRKAAALSLLGVFFGFGALFLPFTLGALVSTFGLDVLLTAAAALCAAAGVYSAVLRFPAPKQRQRLPLADVRRFLKAPLVLTLAALLFFQSGIEFTLGGFVSSYVSLEFAGSVSMASWVLAAYWASLMLARILGSRLLLRMNPATVVIGCGLTAAGGCLLIAAAPGLGVAVGATMLTGFALAGVYPAVLGIAGAAYREHSGTVFGLLFTVALAGGMTLPWLAGGLGQGAGVRWVFGLVAAAFAAVAALGAAAGRVRA